MDKKSKKNISGAIDYALGNTKLWHTFHNLGYLPRWIIFLIDVFVISVTALLSYFLIYRTGEIYIEKDLFIISVPVYLLVSVVTFRVFRTYSGIIRHSSYIDAVKIFFSQFTAAFIFLALNSLYKSITGDLLFLNIGILINAVFSFSCLFLYRVLVKQFFENYLNQSKQSNLTRAIIYGTDANAIAVANALKSEVPGRFKLVGFIDKYGQNKSKMILGLPILQHKKKASTLMRVFNAQALILADKNLSKEEQLTIVDECLDFNYKVYTVPLVSDWEDQKEISRKIKNFQIQDLLERKPIVLDNRSISNQLKGKSVLITGAAGSIGSEIVRQVIQFGPRRIIMLDQAETPLHHLSLEISKLENKSELVTIIGDVRKKAELSEIFSSYAPDVVYHAAAYKHVPLMEGNPSQAIFANILGSKNVADLACEYNVDSFVMVSTDKAVNPSNVMGASKRIAEKYVQSLHKSVVDSKSGKTKFITTRFGNVLGSNGSVVPLFTKQIESGGPITLTHPDIIRYFMTIPEACQLVLEAGAMGKGGEIYIFDMGKPVKIIDLARKMIRLAGFIPEKDIDIKIVGLRPGEKLYEELLNDGSKTLPTHHEKIMIAQDVADDYEDLREKVVDLIATSKTYSSQEIVSKMKVIVPEFKSMNSNFEILDKEAVKK
ncbi:polysaccharide biosynthesis protein CapD [Flavobacterium suaedae]|uniref:Polysaccharide biosynthesis protein CapD n=1 Tax=Flavobacterium suaedae TaxID=1767027 RepID=A0ABQ1JQK7_9FLAO|nr:nucleoside-diphosphate sugar epimerase/dehydratase [Flavobacterium suaedae]GGB72156.1 polysaccharide biosynthesis protein CapD [Flavobacterium suaedae]